MAAAIVFPRGEEAERARISLIPRSGMDTWIRLQREDGTTPQLAGMSEQPESPDVSIPKAFAQMVDTACRDFELLQRLIRQEVKVVAANGERDLHAAGAVGMALAKSFVFHVVRARRICEHGAGSLKLDRIERRRFLAATVRVVECPGRKRTWIRCGRKVRGPTLVETINAPTSWRIAG